MPHFIEGSQPVPVEVADVARRATAEVAAAVSGMITVFEACDLVMPDFSSSEGAEPGAYYDLVRYREKPTGGEYGKGISVPREAEDMDLPAFPGFSPDHLMVETVRPVKLRGFPYLPDVALFHQPAQLSLYLRAGDTWNQHRDRGIGVGYYRGAATYAEPSPVNEGRHLFDLNLHFQAPVGSGMEPFWGPQARAQAYPGEAADITRNRLRRCLVLAATMQSVFQRLGLEPPKETPIPRLIDVNPLLAELAPNEGNETPFRDAQYVQDWMTAQ